MPAAGAEPAVASQDALRLVGSGGEGRVFRGPVADVAAAGEGVEGEAWGGEGGVFRSGSSSGSAGGVGFHLMQPPGSDHRASAVRASALSLRADLFELGIGDGLFFRELRESGGGVAAGAVRTGRRSGSASHRPDELGGEQPFGAEGVHAAVCGLDRPLRPDRGEDAGGRRERERRRRAVAPAFQRRHRPGAHAAGIARFREPIGV